MAGKPVGTMFAEIGLDASKLEKGLERTHKALVDGTIKVEDSYKSLGIKSDAVYEQMRKNATAAVDFIKNKTLSSKEEIVRAEQAAADRIKRINEQQYGAHVSMIDSMKKNWVATAAVVAGAWMAVNKSMAWAEIGAKAQQAEESFRIVANAAGESSEKIIEGMKRAAAGTVDDSDIMQKAVKGMVLGLKGDEMIKIMETARVAARVAGQDVQTAYENITNAIATGMPRALKQYGLATKEETTIVEKALKAGVEGINLYTLAMMNAEIQSAKMGTMQTNAAEGTQYFRAQVHELTETIGKFVIELSTNVFATLKTFAGLLSFVAAPIAYLIGGTEAYNAMVASGNDLLIQAGKLAGHNAEEAKKNTAADTAAASATVERLQKEKAAWIEKLKAQIGAKQAAKDAAALEKEIWNMEIQIAEAVKKIADEKQKRELVAIKLEWETQARQLAAQEKAADEYSKIVTEAADFSVNEHDRATNKIIADENKKLGVLYTLYAEGFIKRQELESAVMGVEAQTAALKEAQAIKELAAQENFYSTIEGFEQEWFDKKVELINREKNMRITAGWDAAAANTAASQSIMRARIDLFDKEHAGINAILAATKASAQTAVGLFREGSKERKIAHNIEMAATIAELAIQAQKNIMIAVGAVAQQGSGDPYSAFARIAAMIAVMTSVLSMAGIAFGGGGVGGGASASVHPPSTVLGAEAGTGSESIGNAWKLLEDTYDLENRELTGIHNSVKELNRNITGLVTSIVRTGAIGEAGTSSYSPGFMQNQGEIFADYYSKIVFASWATHLGGMFGKFSGWAGDVVNNIFGGGASTSMTSGGIQLGGSSVSGLLSGGGMGGRQYADITTQHKGGWFHDDWTSRETKYATLDRNVSDMLDSVFQNLGTTLVDLAKGLGTDTQKALDYVFAETKIDLHGKSAEDINKAISEFISNTADKAVESLFGEMLRGYQQLNEGLFETAARLVTDKAIVTEILTMTNQGLPGSTAQIIAFSESLIEMAGGLDVLQEASATYYDKFFTDAEKQTRLQAQLSSGLGSLGYALPGERSGYRALVEGLDLTTEAGKEAYVALLKWSAAADEYYSVVEDAAGGTDKLTESLRNQAETITKWLADLNKSALAPVTSARAYEQEYERMKVAAYGPGATEADTSAFLAEASTYLKFARAYGGDYADIYAQVTGDVKALGDMKTYEANQLDAIREADLAAREASRIAQEQANELARLIAGIPPGQTARTMGSGGLAGGVVVAGEMGPEWVVPTYEPQRSRFLESAPPQFWENLRGAGVVQQGGGGGPIQVTANFIVDGKVLGRAVAREIPRNAELAAEIRRTVN